MRKKSFLTVAVSSMAAGSIALIAPTAYAQTSGTGGTGGYVLPTTGGGNAGESGRDSSKAQLIGAAANIGAAGMYMGICSTVYGSWACPLAGLAAVAASLLGNASKGSSAAGGDMSAFDPIFYGPGGPGTGNGNGNATDPTVVYDNGPGGAGSNGTDIRLPDGTTPQTIARDVARIRSGLEQAGVTISPDGKTMTTKDGRTFDLGAAGDGSMSGLMAMGLSASEAAQADAAGKKYAAANASKFANMAKLGADGGGGGAAGRGPAGDDTAGGGGFNFNFNDPRNKKRAAAKVSGLTRKLGDDTIGVSGDNIFEMVTRRYKARDQVNNFLKD